VHKVTGQEITKMIIGNKNDLAHLRQVPIVEAKQYALQVGASLIETSAKTADNVEESFKMIAAELVRRGKVARKSICLQSSDDDSVRSKKCC